MAAEAAAVQCEESASTVSSLPVAHYLQRETSLAGFLGHVQLGFSRADDTGSWKKLEQQLETVRCHTTWQTLLSRKCLACL